MNRLNSGRSNFAKISVLTTLLGVSFSQAAHAQATTYSGDAYGVSLTILPVFPLPGVVATIADTGQLPSAGGSLSANLATASIQNGVITVVNTGVINTATSGAGGVAQSSATVNGLSALGILSASTVTANSQATAGGVTGSSVITNLVFNGSTITVTGAPNQTINVGGLGTLVINEQINTSVGNHHQITTNALDLTLLNATHLIVSHAESDITAVPEPSSVAIMSFGMLSVVGMMLHSRKRRLTLS